MSMNQTHPYTLELSPSPKGDGSVGWAIRKHGKMLERSDRMYRTQHDALRNGQEAVGRTLSGVSQPTPSRRRG